MIIFEILINNEKYTSVSTRIEAETIQELLYNYLEVENINCIKIKKHEATQKGEREEMYTNIKLEWVAPYGSNKGKKVSSWFQFGDPDIERLKREFNAIEVKRV